MILKKEEISLSFLGEQVLELCSMGHSLDFQEGYLNFTCIFFEELDVCSDPFLISVNPYQYEVDLSMVADEVLKELDRVISDSKSRPQVDFWLGVDLAFQNAFRVLNLAYKFPTGNDLAA